MSNQVTTTSNTLAISEYTEEQVALIKRTVCKDSTDDELQLFLHVCKQSKLDPFAKQIHAIKRHTKAGPVMSIQVGIDGQRLIAHRTGKCLGISDPEFVYKVDPTNGKQIRQIDSATVTVKKLIEGHVCEFKATAFWDEYYPGDRLGYMWRQRPKGQLGKCAEALALRKAFPSELSAIYSEEEMQKADAESEVIEEVITKPKINYTEQIDQMDYIKNKLAEITSEMGLQEKGQYFVEVTGVSKFDLLKSKTNAELDLIIKKLDEAA